MILQDDAVPESPVPLAVMPKDIFDLLKGNVIMKSINAELVPIMIATEGTDFYDKNHTKKLQTTLRISSQLRILGVHVGHITSGTAW